MGPHREAAMNDSVSRLSQRQQLATKVATLLQNRAKLDVVMKDGKFVECHLTPGKAVAKAA